MAYWQGNLGQIVLKGSPKVLSFGIKPIIDQLNPYRKADGWKFTLAAILAGGMTALPQMLIIQPFKVAHTRYTCEIASKGTSLQINGVMSAMKAI